MIGCPRENTGGIEKVWSKIVFTFLLEPPRISAATRKFLKKVKTILDHTFSIPPVFFFTDVAHNLFEMDDRTDLPCHLRPSSTDWDIDMRTLTREYEEKWQRYLPWEAYARAIGTCSERLFTYFEMVKRLDDNDDHGHTLVHEYLHGFYRAYYMLHIFRTGAMSYNDFVTMVNEFSHFLMEAEKLVIGYDHDTKDVVFYREETDDEEEEEEEEQIIT